MIRVRSTGLQRAGNEPFIASRAGSAGFRYTSAIASGLLRSPLLHESPRDVESILKPFEEVPNAWMHDRLSRGIFL